MDNLYDSTGRKIIVDRTNGQWTPEGGYGGAGHYAWQERNPNDFCSYGERKEGADNE